MGLRSVSERQVDKYPYILVLGSHKGGTGRTTCALALAQVWNQAGFSVGLVDAEIGGGVRWLFPPGDKGYFGNRVRFFPGVPERQALGGCDIVVIDAPPLTEPDAQPLLQMADGLLLTCMAEPLSLSTFPAAVAAIERAGRCNPQLELLGLVVAIYHEQDELQVDMLDLLRQTQGDLLLEPPIPYQRDIAHWVLRPGTAMPAGPARDAYRALAANLDEILADVAAV